MEPTRTALEIAQSYIATYEFEYGDAAGNLRVHRPSEFTRHMILDAILGMMESEEFCRALIAEMQHFDDAGDSNHGAHEEGINDEE